MSARLMGAYEVEARLAREAEAKADAAYLDGQERLRVIAAAEQREEDLKDYMRDIGWRVDSITTFAELREFLHDFVCNRP